MPKKLRNSSEESSSEDSDDSRSSSPSASRRSRSPAQKKSNKISSSRHHSRKSRKSYKHRDDKKKKRRYASSSSRSAASRSDSRSRGKGKYPSSKSREREKEREQKKKQQVPALSEEEQEHEKERIQQIRRAKLLSMKYEQDDDAPANESPVLTTAPQDKMEEFPTERLDNGIGLVDELEVGDDEEKSTKEQAAGEMEEEIDPLDAYMNGIDQVAKQQVLEVLNKDIEAKVDKSHVITAEELETIYRQPEMFQHKAFAEEAAYQNANDLMEEEQEDDDEFHKVFMKAMKRKETKKPLEQVKEQKEDGQKKKTNKYDKGEILDDDDEGDYMAFREDNESDTDYVTKQKKQVEKKELKPADTDIEYEPFRKNFFIESKEIADMTPEEVAEYRKDLGDIQVRGKDCPRPIKNWYQMGLSDAILELITEKKKFANPFPIQCQASPAIMSGSDVIGVAETGSGKTLAYVLPMLRHIKDQRPLADGDGPIGLIMAPTRELAKQIYLECRAFARAVGMNVARVYGGADVQGQIADLKRGAEIVVCTPGRMIDVLSTSNGKITNLRRVTFVVLDEADRMLDSGFGPQIGRILANVRPDHQTAMFSATFPRNVENLAKKVLTRPIEIIVGSREKISSNIDQIIEVVKEDDKFLKLLKILGEWSEKGSVLIFMNKQADADNLFKELLKCSYLPLVLHGGQDPDDRENTISDFKKGVRTLMIATSLCARGLDIKSLVLVVNYQCPHLKEDYIHRIGRTGRAGNKGTAITFITKEEDQYAYDIVTVLKMSNIEPPQDLIDLVEHFSEQVNKGERKRYANSNLGGHGYVFDPAERAKVKDAKRALKRQYDLELNMSDVSSDEDIITHKETKEDQDKGVDEDHLKKMLKDPNTRTAVTRAAEKAAKDAILAGASSEEVFSAANNAIRSILSQYRGSGLDRVVELVGEIEEREDENNERFSADLEINDYPQGARNKVCHRDFFGMIHDLTNCNVTIRGTYFEPGKKVPANQKKLRLHVVGESKHEVENAYREIRRVFEETAAYSMNAMGGQTGKFTL